MSIDRGQSLTYQQDFPVPGISQSSQQFRDNFTILRSAVESLQGAASTADSVLALAARVAADGAVTVGLGFRDNAFSVPQGEPGGGASAGMIRYNAGRAALEFHNGSGWQKAALPGPADTLTVAGLTVTGGLFVQAVPTQSAHAVPRGYLDARLGGLIDGGASGVAAAYNTTTQRYALSTRAFTVTLAGAVAGAGTVSNLGDVTIATTTDRIRGVTLTSNGARIGGSGQVRTLALVGNAITATADDADPSLVTLTAGTLGETDVQGIVGTMLSGSPQRGIAVAYEPTSRKIAFDVADFTVTLSGAVTGSASIADLRDTTIVTALAPNSVALGTDTTGDYVASVTAGDGLVLTTPASGGGAAVALGLDTASGLFSQGVRTAAQDMLTGPAPSLAFTGAIQRLVGAMAYGRQRGIAVTHDNANGFLDFDVADPLLTLTGPVTGSARVVDLTDTAIATTARDFAITLTGGVAGTGTVSNLGDVTIDTVTDAESVQDIVGAMIGVQQGIAVTYDDPAGTLNFDVNDPTIRLTGPITGSARMVDLTDTAIATTARAFTITLAGDLSGSATVSNLTDVTIDAQVADNSHSHFHTIPAGTSLSPAGFGHGLSGFDADDSPDMPQDPTPESGRHHTGFVAMQGPGTRGLQLAGNWDTELAGPKRVSVRVKDDTQAVWGAWRGLAWTDELAACLPLGGGAMTGGGDIVFPIVRNGAAKGLRWSGVSDAHAIFVEEIANTEVTRLVIEMGDNTTTAVQTPPDHMVIRGKAGETGGAVDIATLSPLGVAFHRAVRGVVKTVTPGGGALTLDMNDANYFDCTAGGALTLASPSNMVPGQGGFILLRGATAIGYGPAWKFAGGTRPQGSGGVDRLDYLVVSASEIHASLARSMS